VLIAIRKAHPQRAGFVDSPAPAAAKAPRDVNAILPTARLPAEDFVGSSGAPVHRSPIKIEHQIAWGGLRLASSRLRAVAE